MPEASHEISVTSAVMAVVFSDISLAFDNALANSQMAHHLPREQQRRALMFGMLLSCATMIILTFLVVQIRAAFDWVRYPAGLWLLVVVYKLWFDKSGEVAKHAVSKALMRAIFLIAFTDLTMAADNAIANSEFALRAGPQNIWIVLICGLLISCIFMIICTYAIVWIRKFAEWVKYPAGVWLLYVAYLILNGSKHG